MCRINRKNPVPGPTEIRQAFRSTSTGVDILRRAGQDGKQIMSSTPTFSLCDPLLVYFAPPCHSIRGLFSMLTLDIPFDTMSCEPPDARLFATVRNPHSIERNVADTRVDDQLIH
jgi:hypothetical protein